MRNKDPAVQNDLIFTHYVSSDIIAPPPSTRKSRGQTPTRARGEVKVQLGNSMHTLPVLAISGLMAAVEL